MTTQTTLSEEQTRAAHTPIGPTLIAAGPGSGKTRVVTERVNWMIRAMRTKPQSVLVFTFTNRAATEIQERLKQRLGPEISEQLYAGTFHSWGAKFLKQYPHEAGLSEEFTICDQDDSVDIVRQAMHNVHHPEETRPRMPQMMARDISRWKSRRTDPESLLKRWKSRLDDPPDKMPKPALKALVYDEYEYLLRQNNSVDFDDLINLPLKTLQQNPDILADLQKTVEHIIVDEYQDTSRNQHELATMLANREEEEFPSIFIVGDSDQAIYAFRNADLRNITQFRETDYPTAREIPLNDNYRSSPEIISAAQHLIDHNQERIQRSSRNVRPPGKPLKWMIADNPEDEAKRVAEAIKLSIEQGREIHDHCIVYRTNPQSRPVEEALRDIQLPYIVVGNQEFYKRAEVRRYLDYLSLAINRHNSTAIKRIINVPNRDVDSTTIQKLEEYSVDQEVSLRTAIAELPLQDDAILTDKIRERLIELDRAIKQLGEMREAKRPIPEFINFLSSSVGLKQHFGSVRDGAQRLPNIGELEQIAENSPDQTVDQFLERTIVNHDSRIPQEERITVTTIHQTKGLEFPCVYIIGTEEGLIPHSRSVDTPPELEEERRLMYVGMTRAEDELTICWCRHRPSNNFNQPEFPERSRFIEEIPEDSWETPLPDQLPIVRTDRFC